MSRNQGEMEFQRRYDQIVAKAWSDPAFKARLLTETATVLRENGISIPPGFQVQVVEQKANVIHFPLPSQPAGHELSQEQLEHVAAGIIIIGGIPSFGLNVFSMSAFNQSAY
jgi:hypothetical protein